MVKKKYMTAEERAEKCHEIYDKALMWLDEQVDKKQGNGTGAAIHLMGKLREEIISWENNGEISDKVLTLTWSK